LLLAAHADVTYVDWRTHEVSRQARPAFASLVRYLVKAAKYGEIAGQFAAQVANVDYVTARQPGFASAFQLSSRQRKIFLGGRHF
jgi:hypothetical protein